MAAIFIDTKKDAPIFKGALTVATGVQIKDFSDMVGAGYQTIITDIGIRVSDTIQYFMSFDDVIEFLYFGKGMSNIVVNGLFFTDCSSEAEGFGITNVPGVQKFYNLIGAYRGKRDDPLIVSVGSIAFTCVLTDHSVNFVADPDMLAQFQLNLAVIDHNIPNQAKRTTTC